MSWYLKKADGEIFGPVEDDTLLQWAREGRILPSDSVSADRQEWVVPATVDALGLDWFIPMTDGTPYGPIHALAMAELIADGSLGLDDTIAHKTTREVRRVCEVLVPATIRHVAALRDTLAEEQDRAQKSDIALTARDAEILRLNKRLAEETAELKLSEATAHQRVKELQESEQELRKAIDASRSENLAGEKNSKTVERLRAELQIARGASEDREKEIARLKQQLEEAAAQQTKKTAATAPGDNVVTVDDAHAVERARTELKEALKISEEREKEIQRIRHLLDDELARARQREVALGERVKHLQESEVELLKSLESQRDKAALAERKIGGGTGSSDYGSLVQSYDDLSKNYELLMEQFAAKTGDLTAAYSEIEKLKKETEERVARLDETMRKEREDADHARQRLLKAEEAHLELVRSYRELNDRHIRYRQKMESPANIRPDTAAGETKPKIRLV